MILQKKETVEANPFVGKSHEQIYDLDFKASNLTTLKNFREKAISQRPLS